MRALYLLGGALLVAGFCVFLYASTLAGSALCAVGFILMGVTADRSTVPAPCAECGSARGHEFGCSVGVAEFRQDRGR